LIFTDNLKGILEPYKNNLDKHIFIIGGREIYQQTYSYADYYYVSVVKRQYEGNVFFPFSD
jgi:dihydrofolate reductase